MAVIYEVWVKGARRPVRFYSHKCFCEFIDLIHDMRYVTVRVREL